MSKLHLKMTAEQFKVGYWYASELKAFARLLDMRGYSKQRKDQLEARILQYLVLCQCGNCGCRALLLCLSKAQPEGNDWSFSRAATQHKCSKSAPVGRLSNIAFN